LRPEGLGIRFPDEHYGIAHMDVMEAPPHDASGLFTFPSAPAGE
jgi:hypothetical protein